MPEILQYNHCFMYFPRCLCKLMASKTRILVTNKIEHLSELIRSYCSTTVKVFSTAPFQSFSQNGLISALCFLGLEAYDNVSAERRCSILTETLHRVSVDESAGMRPERSAFARWPHPCPVTSMKENLQLSSHSRSSS